MFNWGKNNQGFLSSGDFEDFNIPIKFHGIYLKRTKMEKM